MRHRLASKRSNCIRAAALDSDEPSGKSPTRNPRIAGRVWKPEFVAACSPSVFFVCNELRSILIHLLLRLNQKPLWQLAGASVSPPIPLTSSLRRFGGRRTRLPTPDYSAPNSRLASAELKACVNQSGQKSKLPIRRLELTQCFCSSHSRRNIN